MPVRRYSIVGRVQGVGFRYFTRNAARQLGIVGYVRNLPDGSVEALGEGDAPTLEQWEKLLRQGPPGARVTSLTFEEAVSPGETGFRIR
jgi:acylphosphatase